VAVYEGARPGAITLPPVRRSPRTASPRTAAPPIRRVGAEAPALPRRRRAIARSRRRSPAVGLVLAAIVVAFAAAFFSLSQDIRVSATGYQAESLSAQGRRLDEQAQEIRNQLNRLGKAPAIKALAVDAGFGPLPEPIVVTAR
jgi:hypothetical protein